MMLGLEDTVFRRRSEYSVKLVLKNNIALRTMRQSDRAAENLGKDVW